MIKSVLGLGTTTPTSLETTGPLQLPTGAEVIAVLENLAKGEKLSAQDIQKAIKKKFTRKYMGKKLIQRHLLDLLARLAHDEEKHPMTKKSCHFGREPRSSLRFPENMTDLTLYLARRSKTPPLTGCNLNFLCTRL